MKRSQWPLAVLILLLVSVAFFGFLRLFEFRFQSGDIYPPYSSLRTDPLGTKVLHDALQQVSGLTVSRNYQSLNKIPGPGGAAIFYTGASTDPWGVQDAGRLETLARNGARLIVTLLPVEEISKTAASPRPKKPGAEKKANGPKKESEPELIDFRKIARGWGITLAYRTAQANSDSSPLIAYSMLPDTEASISWHTALYFPKPSPEWRVLYRCDGAPSIMERPFGRGSIVLAADSYFLSNEAMRTERTPRLLASLLGSHSRIIFDETHLGVQEKPGIATLVRKYNLGGLMAAIAILAALFVWHSSSFLPPRPDYDDTEIIMGKDSSAGFVSLLRRGIAPSRLIEVCVDQWKKSLAHIPGNAGGMLAQIESAAAQGGREPVGTYRAISQILAEKK